MAIASDDNLSNEMTQPGGDRMLYWSKRGEVACGAHAPLEDNPRWADEGWMPLIRANKRIEFQCQYCAGSPIRHSPGHPNTLGPRVARPASLQASSPISGRTVAADPSPRELPASVVWRFIAKTGRTVECVCRGKNDGVEVSVRYDAKLIRSVVVGSVTAAHARAAQWRQTLRRNAAFTESHATAANFE